MTYWVRDMYQLFSILAVIVYHLSCLTICWLSCRQHLRRHTVSHTTAPTCTFLRNPPPRIHIDISNLLHSACTLICMSAPWIRIRTFNFLRIHMHFCVRVCSMNLRTHIWLASTCVHISDFLECACALHLCLCSLTSRTHIWRPSIRIHTRDLLWIHMHSCPCVCSWNSHTRT